MSSAIYGIGNGPQVISGASRATPRQPQGEVSASNVNNSGGVNASQSASQALESLLKSLNETLAKESSASAQKKGMKLDQYV
ncbi:MAG: hypothetical protein PH343_10345 [Nitrospira sp.]|nr:hypothetical protein [Nitrospira sp.]